MKKVICLGLAAVLACVLCGCGKNSEAAKLNVTLNGTAVSSPLTVEKLGADYAFTAPALLKYKGEYAAVVTFDGGTGDAKTPIKSIITSSKNTAPPGILSVNGIALGSSSADVLSVFGEPSANNDVVGWTYREKGAEENEYYLSFYFDDEKVSNIYVHVP